MCVSQDIITISSKVLDGFSVHQTYGISAFWDRDTVLNTSDFGVKSRAASFDFYQRVSIASYASAGIARAEMSVRPLHSGIVSKRRKLAS